MHPKDYLADCAELLSQAFKFEQALDTLVGQFFNQSRRAGARERESMANVLYTVMRKRALCEHLARTDTGVPLRRMVLIGFALSHGWPPSTPKEAGHGGVAWDGPAYLRPALQAQELAWLDEALQQATAPGHALPPKVQRNMPEWLSERLEALIGSALPDLCHALEQVAPLDVRVNSEKVKRAAVQERLTQAGIACTPTPYSPWGLRLADKVKLGRLAEFEQGLIEVQDEGSQLIALLTQAKRHETVVDFCAGGGGKTLALGAMMRNTGRLYAYDTSAQRLEGLKPRLQKSGLTHVQAMAIAHEGDERLARMRHKVDRVLVDAPCSGTGTLRRNPALKWRLTPDRITELVQLQQRILAAAAQLVAPGGRLVYATCSLLHEENEAVAEAFSNASPDFIALPVIEVLQRQKVEPAQALCSSEPPGLYLRLWPHRGASDGFFAAIWQRR